MTGNTFDPAATILPTGGMRGGVVDALKAERPRGGPRGRHSAPCRLGGVVVKPAPALRPFRKAVRRTVPVSVIMTPLPVRIKPERPESVHILASPDRRLGGGR